MKYVCPNCGADDCDPIAWVGNTGMRLIECVHCDNFYEVYPEED